MGANLQLPAGAGETVTEVGKRLLHQSDKTIVTVLEKTPYITWDKDQTEQQKLEAIAEARSRVIARVASFSENLKQIHQYPQFLAGAVACQASTGFEGLKHFGRNQLFSVVPVDLIEFAIEVVDNAQQTAKSHFGDANRRLAEAVLKVSSSISVVQEYWRDRTEQTKQISIDLREKLHIAIAHAKELGQHGVHFVGTLKASLTIDRLSQLPADSVKFLNESPALFSQIYKAFQEGRIRHSEVPSIVAAVYALLGAIREVVFSNEKAVTNSIQKETQVQTQSTPTHLPGKEVAPGPELGPGQELLLDQFADEDGDHHERAPGTEETEQDQHDVVHSDGEDEE